MTSPYSFTETLDSFTVRREGGPMVEVYLDNGSGDDWKVGFLRMKSDCTDGTLNRGCSLIEFYNLNDQIAELLTRDWKPKPDSKCPEGILRLWAAKVCARSINKRVHAQWERLLTRVPPDVVTLQRKAFSSTFIVPSILHNPHLFEHPYLVADLKKYRAAHYVAALSVSLNHTLHWRSFLSDLGEPYRALNITLDQLPGALPISTLQHLNTVHLDTPVTDRATLIALCKAAERKQQGDSPIEPRTIQFERRENILRACQMIYDLYPHWGKFSSRKAGHIASAVSTMLDYPDEHKGGLVSLAEKSVRYHRDDNQRMVRRATEWALASKSFNRETDTARPSIPLPADPFIRFLDTAGAIIDEGQTMQHCVGQYAGYAVNGSSYFFHVDYKDTAATVQVSPLGEVAQAYGPHNEHNAASAYGTSRLKRWGRALSQAPTGNPMKFVILGEPHREEFPR